jgi:hypothetical protein
MAESFRHFQAPLTSNSVSQNFNQRVTILSLATPTTLEALEHQAALLQQAPARAVAHAPDRDHDLGGRSKYDLSDGGAS